MNLVHGSPWACISGRSIAWFFACGLVLCCLSDVPNTLYVPYVVARTIVGGLLVATLFMPFRPAILLMLLLALAGKDVVLSTYIDEEFATSSIWQLRFGPVRPSWFICTCMLWQLLKVRNVIVPSTLKWATIWFATVPLIIAVFHGNFADDYASIEVLRDVKFALMLLISIFLFVALIQIDERNLPRALAALVGALLARHLVDLVYFLANLGPALAEGVSRGSLDSAKSAVIFLIFLGTVLVCAHKRFLLGSAIAIPSVLLLIAYATRQAWITFLLGGILLLLLLKLRQSVFFISVAALLAAGGIWVLSIAHPRSAETVLGRAKTITEGRPVDKFAVAVEDNLLSRIDPIRYGELLNLHDSLEYHHAYLWGTGYGGYYEDNVVAFTSSLEGASAFPDYSLATGRFYRAHFFPPHMILKYGLIGSILICMLWIGPGYVVLKLVQGEYSSVTDGTKLSWSVVVCLVAFLPTAMFELYWSGKGLFINGLVIASCAELARLYSSKPEPREAVATNEQRRLVPPGLMGTPTRGMRQPASPSRARSVA